MLVAAIRSRRGASFELLSRVGTGQFEVAVSVPLVFEYEDALLRARSAAALSERDIADLIDYVCSVAVCQHIFFLWRPQLRDAGDDLVLEIAVASDCDAVVTHNVRDFDGAERFGIRVINPATFLAEIRSGK